LHQVYHSYSYLEDAISILLGLHEQYELQYERDKPKKDLIKKSSGGKAIFLSNYFLIIEFHFFFASSSSFENFLARKVQRIGWQQPFRFLFTSACIFIMYIFSSLDTIYYKCYYISKRLLLTQDEGPNKLTNFLYLAFV
jgi:hypothetical protein